MANILLSTLATYWKNISDWVNGTDAVSAPNVTLSGSKMELYGVAIEDRPAANTVSAGTTFTIVDDTLEFDSYVSDGTDWMEV
jgi:hypothetical protein